MSSINRKLANLITSTGDVATSALDNAASMQVFSSVDSLPVSGLSAGDQALVGQRLYISNGSGWYNVALINATPTLSLSQDGSITLANDGTTTTVITLTAADSDNSNANLVLTAESGGDFFKMATVSQDSSVFTITPRSKDSATSLGFDGSSTLTFKASDGIAFASNQVTFTLSFEIANSNYTSLLLQADAAGTDNQVDASTNTHTITEAGDVTSTAFSPYHSGGYSYFFDGTGDVITLPDTATLTFAQNSFTMEGWVYPTDVTGRHTIFTGSTNSSGYSSVWIDINDGQFELTISTGTGTWTILYTDVGAVVVDVWTHFALVRDGSSSLKFYVNGTQTFTTTGLGSLAITDGTTVNSFGRGRTYTNGTSEQHWYDGYIADFRIVTGTAVYTSAFDVPTQSLTAISGTQLLVANGEGYIVDKSTNAHPLTIVNDTRVARFRPYVLGTGYTKAGNGGSVYFDGTDDYLDAGDIQFGANDFTVEGWFYFNSTGNQCLIGRFHNYSSNQCWELIYEGGMRFQTNTGSFNSGTAAFTVTTNQWYHIAAVRSGSNKYLFINGILQSGYPINIGTGALQGESTGTVKIGTRHDLSKDFNGYMSDVRFVTGTAVYTSNFTPPTAPLTAITNTSLLTCTNKNDIWDAGGREALVAKTGDATASNTQRKFTGSSAIYLDGSGDNITMSDLEMGSGDLTFEFWMYQDIAQSSAYRCMLGTSTYGSGVPFTLYTYSSNVALWLSNSGGPHINAAFTATTWQHVAVVRNSGTWKLYVDGTSGGSSTTGGTYDFAATADFRFGENLSGSYDWKGYIQGARFTKGLARYTGNFTPSTTEFTG